MEDIRVELETEFIKLDQLLKYSGVISSGSDAKILIAEEEVKLNGEICSMRGKKIRTGDVVEALGVKIIVE